MEEVIFLFQLQWVHTAESKGAHLYVPHPRGLSSAVPVSSATKREGHLQTTVAVSWAMPPRSVVRAVCYSLLAPWCMDLGFTSPQLTPWGRAGVTG